MSEKQNERTQPPIERQTTDKPLAMEIAIEFADPQNRQANFPPLQERMRSRWNPHALPIGMVIDPLLARVPMIPGLWIKVNTKTMTAEKLDPLGFPENEELASKVFEATSRLGGIGAVDGVRHKPVPTETRRLDVSEMASWIYWMWRHCKTGQAELRRGEFPVAVDDHWNNAKKAILKHFPGATIREDYYDAMVIQEQPTIGQQAVAAGAV